MNCRFEKPDTFNLEWNSSGAHTKSPVSMRPMVIDQSLQNLPVEVTKIITNEYDVDHCDPDDRGDCSLCTMVERDDIPEEIDDYCIAVCSGTNRCHRKAKYGPFTCHGHAPKYCLQHYENMRSASIEQFRHNRDLKSYIHDMRWYEDTRYPFDTRYAFSAKKRPRE